MRLAFIILAVVVTAATVRGQQLVSCIGYKSPYRNLEDQALTKAPASFPAERGFRVTSRVLVLVKVDRNGRVVSARAVCGHPLLVATSVASARQWTFRPRRAHGKRVNSVGTIAFKFGPDASSGNAP